MGLLCTLQLLALRSLVACPSIPLLASRSRDAATFFLAARASDLRMFITHSDGECRRGGRKAPGLPESCTKLRKSQSVTSDTALPNCGFHSGGPVAVAEGDTSTGSESEKESWKSAGINGFDFSVTESVPDIILLNGTEVTKGFGKRGRVYLGPSQEKQELRADNVRSILGSISALQDVTLVAAVLNNWLKTFASSVANSSRQRRATESNSAFVPYSQVARIVHSVMQNLGQSGHFHFALEVLRWMEAQGWCQLDPHMYTTIISTLGEAGSFELAETIFEGLESTQVVKDPALLNAMLNTRGKAGQIDSLEDLFESMKTVNSVCKPDLVTYNTVMNSYVKAGMGLSSVVDVFREMYSCGIQPDLVSFDILLEACNSGSHVQEAERIFGNLKKRGLKPSVVTYTTLIALYADSGHCTKALRLLRDMLKEGCQPNTRTFSSLITACGRVGFIEEAERMFQTMERSGVEPNVVTFNAMIDMYGKSGDSDMALKKYRELELAGLTPTGVTISSIMSSLKAAAAYEEAVVFYNQAKVWGICNEHVFTEAIDIFIKWGRIDSVKGVQADMAAAKCFPNVVTCSIVLAALGSKCNTAADAAVLVDFLSGFESDLPRNVHRMLSQKMTTDREVRDNIQKLFLALSRDELQTWTIFTCALVDALWSLGWRRRCAHVVGWAVEKGLFNTIIFNRRLEWKLDLRRLSQGSALVVLYQWLGSLVVMARRLKEMKAEVVMDDAVSMISHTNGYNEVRIPSPGDLDDVSMKGVELLVPLLLLTEDFVASQDVQLKLLFPQFVTIVTGWGKLSKQPGSSPVQKAVHNEITKLGAPFELSLDSGRWMTSGQVLVPWLTNPAVGVRLELADAVKVMP